MPVSGWNCPALHDWQVEAPVAGWNVPKGQGAQAPALWLDEKRPAEHLAQVTAPVPIWKFPALQFGQVDEADEAWYLPTEQSVHSDAMPSEYLPAAHTTHTVFTL